MTGPGGLEGIISRCPHLSRGRATGHMIQEKNDIMENERGKGVGASIVGRTEASTHPGPRSEEHG